MVVSCLASTTSGEELPTDPVALVETLASPNRQPLDRWPSEEVRRGWEEIVATLESRCRQAGDEPNEEFYRTLDEFLPTGMLDELRPKNPLNRPFDQAARDRVAAARRELERMGVAAFDALIAARNDGRYSKTESPLFGCGSIFKYPGCTVNFNRSVGDVCEQIIGDQLNIRGSDYKGSAKFIPDGVPRHRLPQWWASQRGKSLDQLKWEARQWTLAEERRRAATGFEWAQRRVRQLEAEDGSSSR